MEMAAAGLETQPFLPWTGGKESSSVARTTEPGSVKTASANCRSRYKVLVVGDKRPKVYPRYRSARKSRPFRSDAGAYRGLPSGDAVTKLQDVSTVDADLYELVESGRTTADNLYCSTPGESGLATYEGPDEFESLEREWKLVGEAVSDGIRRVYGSSEEQYRISPDSESNSCDVDLRPEAVKLTHHLPRVAFDVDSGRVEGQGVDESAEDSVWLTLDGPGTKRRRRRRRGRNSVCSTAGPAMDSTRKPPPRDSRHHSRCMGCFKSFLTFLFSTIGLTCLLVGYCIVGGLLFMELEADNENRTADEMERLRREHLEQLWEMTARMNVLHPDNWTSEADLILKNYTIIVYQYTKVMGWDVGVQTEESQWSFAGSLLYSITVITTIGYGHIAPKTSWGRVMTIVYAIFGIPLTLLTITNLGGFMASAFRFLYRNICCTLCCICCYPSEPTNRSSADDLETGNNNPPEVKSFSRWATVGRVLTNTDDIRSVEVPITVSLVLIGSYLAIGALLFTLWERDWTYLVGFYFCFVTLSTIGFGDYVPGTSLDAWASQAKLVLCALYLLFGLALIAMCFDLMQEQARSQFRELGRRMRLIESD